MKQKRWLSLFLVLAMLISMVPAVLADDEDTDSGYVLMNIPYDVFYEQVIGTSAVQYDAVTSATTKKAPYFWDSAYKGNAPVAYGEGATIKGVQFPVLIADGDVVNIQAESSADDYYIYDTEITEEPAVYAAASVAADGTVSFEPLSAEPTVLENAEITVNTETKHGQYMLVVEGDGGVLTDADKNTFQVYGAVLTDAAGKDYPLYHLFNLYYKDFHEIAFNTTEDTTGKEQVKWADYKDAFASLESGSITGITWYTNAGVYTVSTNVQIGEKEAQSGYVLMNIPYDEFYAAEGAVDAISSATRNGKARNVNVNGASYHQSEEAVTTEGIAGVIYPVFVEDMSVLASLGGSVVTDESLITYEMTARGTPVAVELKGANALQENPSYSYYVLSEKPANDKKLTVQDGKASFAAISESAGSQEGVTGTVSVGARHADVEIKLSGIAVEAADVSAVIVTVDENAYALHHVVNIWRGTEIGWNTSDMDLAGKTITNVRYYLKDGTVTDYPVEIAIPLFGYKTGTYTGTGKGRNGDITLSVSTEYRKITSITVVSQGETPDYWEKALPLFDTIKKSNSPEVDAISGATLSCNGIKEAVRNALAEAADAGIFASGTGTAGNPYIIKTAEQLTAFAQAVDNGESYEGEYIALGADIDLSGIASWNPIGAESGNAKLFNGTFDGQGYSIDGLAVSGSFNGASVGLFSTLGKNAVIKNLTMTGVNITVSAESGKQLRAGAVAGDTVGDTSARTAIVDSVCVSGSISVKTDNAIGMAGGILGRMSSGSAILNSISYAEISGIATGDRNNGYAGGLAAMNGNQSLFVNCASLGTVTGTKFEGGVAGMLAGGTFNVYTAATVSGAGENTGSVAGMKANADGDCVYYTGAAAFGTYYTDPFETKAITDTGSSLAETLNGNLPDVSKTLGEEELELREWVVESGYAVPVGDIWEDTEPDSGIFESGTGTEEDPYLILTEEQLRAFAADQTRGADYTGKTVKLGADIDVSSKAWAPIGGSDNAFTGTFDGAGYTVSGVTMGTKNEPYALQSNEVYVGFFGVLNKGAVIKDLNLGNISMYLTKETSAYVGAIAGYAGEAVIDGVSVTGAISLTQTAGNGWAAGIAGYQYKGAIINSWTDVDVSCSVTTGNAVAEAGGLVALCNRALVANCYTLGDVYGSASRKDGDEGMAAISGLVGVNGGNLVGCYSAGGHKTGELSYYTGAVSGWVTGIGKAYSCWYNGAAQMEIDGSTVSPVESIGTKVPAGVNEDGDTYTGGVVDDNNPYTAGAYEGIADSLNAKFKEYPIDITQFGIDANALKTWTVQDGLVTFGDGYGSVTYVQPQAEIVPVVEKTLRDGDWFGRDEDKTTVVKITVADGKISQTETVSGENEGESYEAALAKAMEKATYGDTSGYGEPNTSLFDGGSGTEDAPYLISTEAQLRYVAEALGEDNTWDGVYFKQTEDIDVSSAEWLPIGWGIYTEINNAGKQYCVYPFTGNYDGGGYTINGLKIGSANAPTEDPRAQYVAGLFGFVTGGLPGNVTFEHGEYDLVTLENIVLKDLAVNVSSRYANYIGGLVGNAQNGFILDNCSATGTVRSYSQDSHARGGGISANALRGLVTNVWADVDVTVDTDAGNSYGGGLYAMDNRTTTVNCYSLGSVTGNASNTNKVHIGGLTGQCGGAHYNCYAFGDVVSEKPTTDAGILNGRLAGIAVEIDCYFNSEAKLSVAGEEKEPVANGVDVNYYGEQGSQTYGKTATEMQSQAFAELLNENTGSTETKIDEIKSLVADSSHPIYYSGDGSDLRAWTLLDNVVGFFVNPFLDVTEGDWYYNAVAYCYSNQFFQGVSATRFDPKSTMTRAMFATVLYRMAGEPEVTGENPFSDVESGKWYTDAVIWAAGKKIIEGYGSGVFGTNDPVTREQMATIFWRYQGKPTVKNADLTAFSDTDKISAWARDAFEWAVSTGVINGKGNGILDPKGNATRAEVAQIAMNYDVIRIPV